MCAIPHTPCPHPCRDPAMNAPVNALPQGQACSTPLSNRDIQALDMLRNEPDLHEVLGTGFITIYTEIKELEFAEFMKVISPWEREHLLLHV